MANRQVHARNAIALQDYNFCFGRTHRKLLQMQKPLLDHAATRRASRFFEVRLYSRDVRAHAAI